MKYLVLMFLIIGSVSCSKENEVPDCVEMSVEWIVLCNDCLFQACSFPGCSFDLFIDGKLATSTFLVGNIGASFFPTGTYPIGLHHFSVKNNSTGQVVKEFDKYVECSEDGYNVISTTINY